MARILVVDDDPQLLTVVLEALTEAGHEPSGAADGHIALALLGAGEYDVLLTDLYMPGADGFELIQACRMEYPQLPLIVMSGGNPISEWVLASASLLNAAATLSKPFSVDELEAAIARALAG